MSNAKTIAQTILSQLGGNKFTVMTGASKFLFADITEDNKKIWLRMNIGRNAAGINRLKIYYNANDTYTMEFYKQTMNKNYDVKITKQQIFENIYCDQLQEIFTQVTGMYTTL